MATNHDYKKEWFDKARIDYFSPFINLWLACNSWYDFHYSLDKDRDHINKLKSDFTRKNKLFKAFESRYSNGDSKEEKSLLSLLELLHYSLNIANIKPTTFYKRKYLNFNSLLIDYTKKSDINAYENVIELNALTAKGKFKANRSGIILNYDNNDASKSLIFSDNKEKVFAGLVEILYQTRCMLVHGNLAPSKENHDVVKYCYLILYDLMSDFCSNS